jgi:hypothetical protein
MDLGGRARMRAAGASQEDRGARRDQQGRRDGKDNPD